ncbi:transcriptional activator hap3 [Sorochytrium milnesiophthora]
MSDATPPTSITNASMSGDDDDEVKEQDRFLPIANVARIMKKTLPENAKISKEAKECVQECVSEFISFITSESGDRCQQEKRKTVNGEDVLWAMSSLGFDNFAETLKVYLSKYRDTHKTAERPSGGSGSSSSQSQPQAQAQYATMAHDPAMLSGLTGALGDPTLGMGQATSPSQRLAQLGTVQSGLQQSPQHAQVQVPNMYAMPQHGTAGLHQSPMSAYYALPAVGAPPSQPSETPFGVMSNGSMLQPPPASLPPTSRPGGGGGGGAGAI